MENDIKKIPETFGANGYKYKLLKREENVALYEGKNKWGSVCYEVHKIRITEATEYKIGNKLIKCAKSEILAKNEDFGSYGWAYGIKQNAEDKFKSILSLQAMDFKALFEKNGLEVV